MAAPPPKRLITPDDIPGAPAWLGKVLDPVNAFIRATAGALDRGLTFGQQFAGEVKTVTFTQPEDWQRPTLGNGWAVLTTGTNPRPIQIQKMLDGTVRARGRADYPGGTPSNGATFLTLPAGWGTDKREVFDAYASDITGTTYAAGVFAVYGDTVTWAAGGFRNVSLTGDVWWVASDRTPPRWETPLDVRLGTPSTPFPGRPGQVLVLGCRQTEAPTAPAPVAWVDWTAGVGEKNAPVLRIHRVWGLMPGIKYALTLAILPE